MSIYRTNPRKQGDIGVGSAVAWFMRNGYTVSIPVSESQRYDLIVDKDNVLQRVQIKTSTRREPSGGFLVALETRGGNQSWSGTSHFFDKETSDLLFILTDCDDQYLIPTEKLQDNARSIVVGGAKWIEYRVK